MRVSVKAGVPRSPFWETQLQSGVQILSQKAVVSAAEMQAGGEQGKGLEAGWGQV